MRAHENPFSTDRIERLLYYRPEWVGMSWEELETRWQQLGCKGSLIGPHGAGKTTLLDKWVKRIESQGHEVVRLFLNRENRKITDWSVIANATKKVIILDGEEQLDWLARRKFYRLSSNAKGVVVTRHSKGKLPILLTITPSIEVLHLCIQEVAPEMTDLPQLTEWWKEEKGNIRHVLLRCYDHCRGLS